MMRGTGSVLGLAALTVAVAGCGGQTTTTAVAPATHDTGPAVVTAAHLMRPAPPLPPPQPAAFVIESPQGTAMQLTIVDAGGKQRASTLIPAADEWLTAAGPGGAYWLDGGHVHVLAADGSARTLDAVPADASGLLVSPDGASFAYALSRQTASSDVLRNSIVVQRFGGTAQTIAARTSDPSHPTSDAPSSWTYMLLNWTNQGILFIRDAYGGCGCAPYDMEMQAAYTALIDPVSGGTSQLTADSACPLSGLGPYQTVACFHGGLNVDQLRLLRDGRLSNTFTLSGQYPAGGAVFSPDAARLAYTTERQTSSDGCSGTWLPTLHVLSLDGSGARAATIDHFSTARWTAEALYGVIDAPSAWSLVTVDPSSLSEHTLWSGAASTHLIGLT